MSQFIEISPTDFLVSPFKLIGKDWMLITAEAEGKCNTMTASWGGLGVMWGKNVSFVVIRPQRYTKTFIDSTDSFSLSFLGQDYRKQLSYLGTVSGRDEDKIAKSGLFIAHNENVPYFEESETVIICRKLFAQNYVPESFIEESLNKEWYPSSDHHTLYISEVIKILRKS